MGIIRPTNVSSSAVDNIIIIDNDDVADLADGVIKLQECKMEESNPTTETHVSDMSNSENNCISAWSDGGSFSTTKVRNVCRG